MNPRTILLLTVALATTACVYTPDRRYDGRYDKDYYIEGSDRQRILVCHKGKKTMELPVSALDGHLGHGDHRGPCR